MEVKRGDVIVQGLQFDDGTPRPRSLLDEEQTAVETRRLGGLVRLPPFGEYLEAPGLRRLP